MLARRGRGHSETQHLDFLGEWRLAASEAFEREARPARPLGPRTFAPEDEPEPEPEISHVDRTRLFREQLAAWAGSTRKVYWLTTAAELERIQERIVGSDQWTHVTEIVVTNAPRRPPGGAMDGPEGPPRGRGFFGFGGPPPRPERGPGGQGPMRGGPHHPPAHFETPADGKLLLVEWKFAQPGADSRVDGEVGPGPTR